MEDEVLIHYGMPRRSGRYPWGSGEDPYQHEPWYLLDRNAKLKAQGKSEVERALQLGYTRKAFVDGELVDVGDTRKLRAAVSKEKQDKLVYEQQLVNALDKKGWSVKAIAERTGLSTSSVRQKLAKGDEVKENALISTAEDLKKYVADKKYLDVGVNQNLELGCSEERMKNALALLENEGYHVHTVKVPQLGTGKYTTMRVLCEPGTTYSDLLKHRGEIKGVTDYTVDVDGTKKIGAIGPPVSVDSKRIGVRYAEQGGAEKDGMIELRRGVDDISLGKAQYAQVRIAVDGTHYIKGMAVYSDNLPKGVDILVNSNKHEGTPLTSPNKDDKQVLKPMKKDPDNPFGSTLKDPDTYRLVQKYYEDPKTGEKKQSAINVVREQGDWDTWNKSLSSQFLSKQDLPLIKRQLGEALTIKKTEYDEISNLTNPVVKKQLLQSFADGCDYDSVHLQAAALPRQSTKAILAFSDIKEGQIYAPTYKDGERVVLIRYPHAGTFEIPELTVVNKKDTSAKKTIGNAVDAVGINHRTAEQLSGADFDGDTVMVIPVVSNKGERIVNVKTRKPFDELRNFDPKEEYAMPKGTSNNMTDHQKGLQMGMVSNLITDMTLKGAPEDHIIRAVRHSMVVIDAQKHNLNWKQSEKDNNISELKDIYQDGGGASTIISQAKSTRYVNERKQITELSPYNPKTGTGNVDPKTGALVQRESGVTAKRKDPKTGEYYDTGKLKQQESTAMAETSDARTLMSKNPNQKEIVYADYANEIKALARAARKQAIEVNDDTYSPAAHKQYKKEVDSLNEKLLIAQKNAPRERQAQILANEMVRAACAANPNLKDDKDAYKKKKNQSLIAARKMTGASKKKSQIELTDEEWNAIQAGAISKTKLKKIINNCDETQVKQLATPRNQSTISTSQKSRIIAMNNSGRTLAEIAEALGVSTSTVSRVLYE